MQGFFDALRLEINLLDACPAGFLVNLMGAEMISPCRFLVEV